jgi:DNA invertase Pin-like site-specific DNA recombinase
MTSGRHDGRYVAYFRVSTGKQGRSGLGLEAQQETVRHRLNGGNWKIVGQFTEVETGTRKGARPELEKAVSYCRAMGARLIVANVSRLTRDPDFMSTLVAAGVEVEFCDLPNTEGPVGTFMLRQMLSVAELEAGMIAERTRKALAEAKRRGTKLGGLRPGHVEKFGERGNLPAVSGRARAVSVATRQAEAFRRAGDLVPIIAELRASGAVSLREIAAGLNERGVRTARGGEWSAVQVSRVLARAT